MKSYYVIKLDGELWKNTLYKSEKTAAAIINQYRMDSTSFLELVKDNINKLKLNKYPDLFTEEERQSLIESKEKTVKEEREKVQRLHSELDRMEIVKISI